MISIVDWHLEKHRDDETFYIIWGYVLGHPKFLDRTYIHTNVVRSIKLSDEGDRLLVHTKSGSDYELAFADIDLKHIENTQANLKNFDVPAFSMEKCQKIKELNEAEMIAKTDKIIEPNELYLLQYGVLTREAYFKTEGGQMLKIPVILHTGMVQDSYLVIGTDVVDFRYFDYLRGIKPYHWSDGLKAIKIENIGRNDISFYADTEILCKRGEITTIKCEQYGREGLISPDAVNGKSIFDR